MTRLVLFIPDWRMSERRYAVRWVLEGQLGLDVEVRPEPRDSWFLTDDDQSRSLEMPDAFFLGTLENWLQGPFQASRPLPCWRAGEEFPNVALSHSRIQVIAGRKADSGGWHHEEAVGQVYLGLDVFGSVFFMLSRYEEIVHPDRDNHGRFPASASLAARESFLSRPILDEYVAILWAVALRLWPELTRKRSTGRVFVTCDVDMPCQPSSSSVWQLLRAGTREVVKQKDLKSAGKRVRNAWRARKGDYANDPYNTFDWMMETCESAGHQLAFYFLATRDTGPLKTGGYDLWSSFLQELLRKIDARGHEIGLHASYASYDDLGRLQSERRRLSAAREDASGKGGIAGNRLHYLRWDSKTTPGLLEKVGFEYDTTGGFAERPGFRFGTAQRFRMWDWQGSRCLELEQRPLIVMEQSIFSSQYLDTSDDEQALRLMTILKNRALRYGGTFVLLWHNSNLVSKREKRLYRALLS